VSKYTDEQLKDMAQQTLEAERLGDPRVVHLYIVAAMQAGMDPVTVRERIRRLADG